MLRGLDGTVTPQDVDTGRFYLTWNGDGAPIPFQTVRSDQLFDGNPIDKALVFDPKDEPGIWIEDLPDRGAIVRLPEVYIRIDPLAAIGNERKTSLRPGMIIVAASEVIVTVPIHMRAWTAVNLSSGRYVVDRMPSSWVSFAALSLVMGDGDDEREIGRFEAG